MRIVTLSSSVYSYSVKAARKALDFEDGDRYLVGMLYNGLMARQIKGWDEEDAYTPWRKLYCYLQRPGAVKQIKRRTHKRERREAKAAIRKEES
jgi:hypothetical protein